MSSTPVWGIKILLATRHDKKIKPKNLTFTYYLLLFEVKVKVESEKVGLKLNIQKMKIMASGPTTSWEIDGETVETVSDFIFGGAPKSLQIVTAAMKLKDAYSLEGKL